jgi:GDP-L-fucose synthase
VPPVNFDFLNSSAAIFVAGADTLVGGALQRRLNAHGITPLVDDETDLRDARAVDQFFKTNKPEYVFLTAGQSAGIHGNQKFPADLLLDNLLVACHVIASAWRYGAKKLLYVASSCSYPRQAVQPMKVESLMTGLLEPTNEAYATAKLAGIKLCEAYRKQAGANFITGIPANPFGIGDDFRLEESHVIPALLRKVHTAKVSGAPYVELWGSGRPRREFIFADDLADACIFAMQHYDGAAPINLGGGIDLSIAELAETVCQVVGYFGEIRYDATKPDGMPLKALDSTVLLELGWRPTTSFADALQATYDWFLETQQPRKEATHV